MIPKPTQKWASWILDVEASVFLFFFDMMMIPANDYGHSSRSCIIQEHAWKICRIETDFSVFGITCENPDFLQD